MVIKGTLRALLAGLIVLTCATAHAQTYPSKPITILVGTSLGGPLDAIGRAFATHFEKKWGQPTLVEARIGGALALNGVIRAPADGYILTVASTLAAPLFVRDPGFERKDLTPVAMFGQAPYILAVSSKTGAKSLADLIKYSKARADKLDAGTVAAVPHEALSNEMLYELGINGNLIGYKGSAPIGTALIAGELDMALMPPNPQLKNGRILSLAIGGTRRLQDFPQVPTFKELGYSYNPIAPYLLWARTGTPNDILSKLYGAVAEVVRSSEFEATVTNGYAILPLPETLGPDAARRAETEIYEQLKRVVERAGIKPQ